MAERLSSHPAAFCLKTIQILSAKLTDVEDVYDKTKKWVDLLNFIDYFRAN